MRLLLDGAEPGGFNMAADAWLVDGNETALRLYGWTAPTLSLGYAQKADWIDWKVVRSRQVSVVRRPSGGRALLHQHELTYALALPCQGACLREEFARLTGWVGDTLAGLGIRLRQSQVKPRAGRDPGCMAVAGFGELVGPTGKLVGSAQLRRGKRLLQHGVIPFCLDHELHRCLLGDSQPGADLASLGHGPIAAEAFAQAFTRATGQRLTPQPWSAHERHQIEAQAHQYELLERQVCP
ncbi:MAG: hypothetical protein KC910_02035 [Candidatus Eremiobacteraeota bacterium]|nr:hypothetical protein [Candidatus Eremiobacteraeota bacterium]